MTLAAASISFWTVGEGAGECSSPKGMEWFQSTGTIFSFAPVALDQHQPLALRSSMDSIFFWASGVVNGHRAADGHPHPFHGVTAAQGQHGLIENTRHQIDVPAQAPRDLSGVFRSVGVNLQSIPLSISFLGYS